MILREIIANRLYLKIGMGCLIIVVIAWISLSSNKIKNKLTPPMVQIAKVKIDPMPILLQVPGSIEAEQSVVITSQITGTLRRIAFEQGQEVEAGQLLFELDTAPFVQSLDQAANIYKRDNVTLIQNRLDAQRNIELEKMEYVTKQQAEQSAAIMHSQEATVASDETLVKQAEIQLSYTKILSPLAGKTGAVTVRPGDLITASSASPLVTINQLEGVLADFNLTQGQLGQLINYQKKGTLQVEIHSEDNAKFLGKGELVFIDNQVNSQSGTILLKAKIPNKEQALWPGMLINIKMILAIEPKAIVIPIAAIQYDQNGSFVYCLDSDRAKSRRIKVDRQIEDKAVISQGLKLGETILISLPPNLTDNSQVRVETEISEPAASTTP